MRSRWAVQVEMVYHLRGRLRGISFTISVHPEPQHIFVHAHLLPEEDETGRIRMTRVDDENVHWVIQDTLALEYSQSLVAHNIW